MIYQVKMFKKNSFFSYIIRFCSLLKMQRELLRACEGASLSKGGLNFAEFKARLIQEFPRKEKRITTFKTRKELQEYCLQDRNIRAKVNRTKKSLEKTKQSYSPKSPEKDYFKSGSKLTPQQRKLCRCIAHVSAKNPGKCYEGRSPEWKLGKNSENCKNPYAICRSRIGGGGKIRCYDEYDFRKMPKEEVKAVKRLHSKM